MVKNQRDKPIERMEGELLEQIAQKMDVLFTYMGQVGYLPHQTGVARTTPRKLDERATEWAKDAVRKYHERQTRRRCSKSKEA
jgi:hypothetical protein